MALKSFCVTQKGRVMITAKQLNKITEHVIYAMFAEHEAVMADGQALIKSAMDRDGFRQRAMNMYRAEYGVNPIQSNNFYSRVRALCQAIWDAANGDETGETTP